MALLFPQPFWRSVNGNADFFGHVANLQEDRGMFSIFYDLSKDMFPGSSPSTSMPDTGNQGSILLTTVVGDWLEIYKKMSDSQIVSKCVEVLGRMFPQEQIPDPLKSIVTRWGENPFAQMSYSYVAVGSSGEDYDAMAADMEEHVFFAGEVTWHG